MPHVKIVLERNG